MNIMKPAAFIRASLVLLALFSSRNALSSATNIRRSADFDREIASKKKAVSNVARFVQTALDYDSWCQSALGCSSKCSYHSCDTAGKEEELTCQEKLVAKPCTCKTSVAREILLHEMSLNTIVRQDSCNKEALCETYSMPSSRSLNFERPNFRTPPNSISSEGNSKPINIIGNELRRDICALKTIDQNIAVEFQNNNVTSALYAGTTNGAFIKFPGAPFCRDHNREDPISECNDYDPTLRPWYITASTGPRDIVFMFDNDIEQSSPLYASMVATIDQLDARDAVAVRLFSKNEVTSIVSNGTLLVTEAVKSELKDEFKKIQVEQSEGSNASMALEHAFEVLLKAKDDPLEATSNCERYIVLMIGSEDSCFADCGPESDCTCVSELKNLVKEKQESFESPVTLVVFTDANSLGLSKQSNMENLGRSLVCPSGIWSQVNNNDTAQSAMEAFRKFGAFLLFDNAGPEDDVFSSGLYEDASGLGELFTLAVPVYDQSSRSLVAVVGADIAIKELLGSLTEEEARTEVETYSNETRKCIKRVGNVEEEKCKADSLRVNVPGSAPCPPPIISSACVKFSNSLTVFYKSSEKKTYSEAVAACNAQNYSELAVIDTPAKNTFFTSIADADGTWIGLTGKASDGILRWPSNSSSDLRGKVVEYNEAAFKIEDWAAELDDESFTDFCVSADRRGVSRNWNILSCNRKLTYVCELKATTGTKCEGVADPTIYEEEKCENDKVEARKCDDTDGIESANPLCNQTAQNKTEAERYCCGDLEPPTSGNLPVIIGGIAGGFGLLVVVLVAYWILKKYIRGRRIEPPPVTPPPLPDDTESNKTTPTRDPYHDYRDDV